MQQEEPTDPIWLDQTELEAVFPRSWLSGSMSPDDARDLLGADVPAGPSTQAVTGLGWTPERASDHIRGCTATLSKPEAWQPTPDTWLVTLHRTESPSANAPLGFIGFRPALECNPAVRRSLRLWVDLQLVWVTPALRGDGYGLHLAAHLRRYFDSHPVPASHLGTSLKGVEVVVVRQTSPACRWFSDLLVDYFAQHEAMTKHATARGLQRPAWPVLAVHTEDED